MPPTKKRSYRRFRRSSLLLAEAGLSQLQLADHMGVAPNTVGRWFRGVVSPSNDLHPAIVELASVELADSILEAIESERQEVAR